MLLLEILQLLLMILMVPILFDLPIRKQYTKILLGRRINPKIFGSDAYCKSSYIYFQRAFSNFHFEVMEMTPVGEPLLLEMQILRYEGYFLITKQSLSSVTLSVYEDDRHEGTGTE